MPAWNSPEKVVVWIIIIIIVNLPARDIPYFSCGKIFNFRKNDAVMGLWGRFY